MCTAWLKFGDFQIGTDFCAWCRGIVYWEIKRESQMRDARLALMGESADTPPSRSHSETYEYALGDLLTVAERARLGMRGQDTLRAVLDGQPVLKEDYDDLCDKLCAARGVCDHEDILAVYWEEVHRAKRRRGLVRPKAA